MHHPDRGQTPDAPKQRARHPWFRRVNNPVSAPILSCRSIKVHVASRHDGGYGVFVNHLADRVSKQHYKIVKRFDLALKLDAVDQKNGNRNPLATKGVEKRVLQRLAFGHGALLIGTCFFYAVIPVFAVVLPVFIRHWLRSIHGHRRQLLCPACPGSGTPVYRLAKKPSTCLKIISAVQGRCESCQKAPCRRRSAVSCRLASCRVAASALARHSSSVV